MNVPQHDCPPVKDLVHPETDERAEMTLCDYEQAGGNLRRLQAQAERHDDNLFATIEQHKTSLTINRYRTIADRLDAVDKARRKLQEAAENLDAGVFSALEEDVRVVDIAERLGISRWSVYRLSNRGDESGIWNAVNRPGRHRRLQLRGPEGGDRPVEADRGSQGSRGHLQRPKSRFRPHRRNDPQPPPASTNKRKGRRRLTPTGDNPHPEKAPAPTAGVFSTLRGLGKTWGAGT